MLGIVFFFWGGGGGGGGVHRIEENGLLVQKPIKMPFRMGSHEGDHIWGSVAFKRLKTHSLNRLFDL